MQTTLIATLLYKDLRHFRAFLLLWFILLLAPFSQIGTHHPPVYSLSTVQTQTSSSTPITEPSSDTSTFAITPTGGQTSIATYQIVFTTLLLKLANLLQVALSIILIPLLLQDDSQVGTTAFWFTRPISRMTLLVEKTLVVALIILLPLIVNIIVSTANGDSTHDILLAAKTSISQSVLFISYFAALAVLTRSLAEYGLWLFISGIVTFLIWPLCWGGQVFWLMRDHFHNINLHHENFFLFFQTVIYPIAITGNLTAILHQYLTRNTIRSAAILIATAIIIVIINAQFGTATLIK